MSRRWLALVASTALLSACANHVRYASDSFERSKREVVHAEAVIEPATSVLKSPDAELALAVDETVVVHKLRAHVRYDEYTPYRSGYELWEVPVGALCAPAVLVLRVTDTLGFRLVTDANLDAFSDFAFSAFNPLLNLESETRLRRNEIARETEELDRDVQRGLRALAGAPVELALDARTPQRFKTDARGRLHVDLLALAPDALAGGPRVLRISVGGEGKREPRVLEVPISHALSSQLAHGVTVRRKARAAGTSPEGIARALVELDALGFSASALAIERELRAREDANLAWLARLDAALRP